MLLGEAVCRSFRWLRFCGHVTALLLLILVGRGCCASLDLVIMHTNDVHARVVQTNKYSSACSEDDATEDKCYGGVARRLTAIDQTRNRHPNVLLLDAGDQFTGTIWFHYYRGLATSHFMNRLGYDAMALGNHEFDGGASGLAPFLDNVSFPVLSCNIDATNEPLIKDSFVPYVVKMFGGEKVGIVGYTLRKTTILVNPDGVRNLVFLDEVEEVRKVVEAMKAQNINKIIALGHAGIEMDLKIAREVDGVDVVVGGHTNTFLFTGEAPSNEVPYGEYPLVVTQDSGAKVLVVQAFAFGKYLGFLEVGFNYGGEVTEWIGNPILLDSSVDRDPEVLSDVQQWVEPLINYTTTVVGESRVYLDGDRQSCRLAECTMGDFITDAILYNYLLMTSPTSNSWSQTSIVFWNGGGMRASIAIGKVTIENILQTMPFRNTVERIRIKGEHILEALEHSAELYNPEDAKGGFLQMSGVKVVYDLSKDAGSRVRHAYVRCTACATPVYEKLDPNEIYDVLLPDYLLQGGDGYSVFRDEHLLHDYIGIQAEDWLMEYFQQNPLIFQELGNRISFVGKCEDTIPPIPCGATYLSTAAVGLLLTFSLLNIFLFG